MSINQIPASYLKTRHFEPKPVNEMECILGQDVPCDEVGSEFDANRYLSERRRERPASYVLRSTATTIVVKLKIWAYIAMGLLGLAILYVGT